MRKRLFYFCTHTSHFTCSATDGTYTALFPAPANATVAWNNLSLKYTGQTQNADNITSHIAPYNYMVAGNVSVSGNAAAATFTHLGSVLQFTITMPADYDPSLRGQPVELIITAPEFFKNEANSV